MTWPVRILLFLGAWCALSVVAAALWSVLNCGEDE